MTKVKVGINGYGVIGKRVADVVSLQSDMKLVGISDVAFGLPRLSCSEERLSIVLPENIDAIRTMTELERDPMCSTRKVDETLGIAR